MIPARKRSSSPRAGFTLVEISLVIVVLIIGLGAVTISLVGSNTLRMANRETNLASEAVQSMIERVRATDFGDVFATYNADPADDPGGAGSAFGNTFAVRGLTVQAGDADGLVGEISFPGDGVQLREDVNDDGLGMPRDLNADEAVDALNHSGDYTLIPMRVRVEWTGVSGNRSLEVVTTLTQFL